MIGGKEQIDIEYFYMDFNPIIYLALKEIQNAYFFKTNNELETKLLETIVDSTEFIVNDLVKPKKLLHIAIDGPAPKCKLMTQRARRYKGIYERQIREFLRKKYADEAKKLIAEGKKNNDNTNSDSDSNRMSKTNANRLICSSDVCTNLAPMGVIPKFERQARPLTKLNPEQQRETWQMVVETGFRRDLRRIHGKAASSEATGLEIGGRAIPRLGGFINSGGHNRRLQRGWGWPLEPSTQISKIPKSEKLKISWVNPGTKRAFPSGRTGCRYR